MNYLANALEKRFKLAGSHSLHGEMVDAGMHVVTGNKVGLAKTGIDTAKKVLGKPSAADLKAIEDILKALD